MESAEDGDAVRPVANDDTKWTVHLLRRRWKPTKERLVKASRNGSNHPLPIRLHRAFSWLAAAEKLPAGQCHDQSLIFRWIAFNALYGRWNKDGGCPCSETECIRVYCSQIASLDAEGRLANVLQLHSNLVMRVFEDKFVNDHFWRALQAKRNFNEHRGRKLAERWYFEQDWAKLLDECIDRVYLVRCQLVHGASTFESQLNRVAVANCSELLEVFLFAMLLVMIDNGLSKDWGDLCYPPCEQLHNK